ncbi:MAG: deoxyuridine 5'-triphosphate nucleotidohydrolase [Candidatus Bathyarchaeia archaeon]
MLNMNELKRLIDDDELIRDFINLDKQIQPCGFDLSLREIRAYEGAGAVDFSNEERVIAETNKISPDADGWWELSPGCYVVIYNETVKIPLDLAAIARPRSSMLRNAATVETAVWDPGYEGRSSSLLIVYNQHGLRLRKNARIVQLVFVETGKVDKGYDGDYQGERM